MKAGKRKWPIKLAVFVFTVIIIGSVQGMCAVYAKEEDWDKEGQENETAQEEEKMTEEELSGLQAQVEKGILSELDMEEIDAVLGDIFSEKKTSFLEVLQALLDGRETVSPEVFVDYLTDTLFYVVKENRQVLLYLLLLIIVASVFSNFSNIFQNRQIAQIGFYMVYILLITLCLHSFQITVDQVSESLTNLTVFMKVLGPAYFLSMAIATGSASSIAFYSLVIFLIYLVDLLILHVMLPLIHVCLMVQILNFLSDEEILSKSSELLETVIGWILKTLLACVTGVGIVQGLLGPAMDAVKRSAFTRGTQMIPGVGDIIGGTGEVILGTAVLIKNGIGVAGAVFVTGICLVPLMNMGILTLMYRGMAAVIQPVSDKRIVEAVNSVGKGYQMLLRVVFTTGVLFLITIAVTAVSTT